MIKGYARVSTDGQDLATQHELLKEAGATLVYAEKQSGIKTDRAALARCLASLEPGDTVLVTKLDRWRDRRGTYSTLSRQSAMLERASSRWAILGQIPRPRTAG
jgi:DNA invertase Pin-like site-specific DNA recombinase